MRSIINGLMLGSAIAALHPALANYPDWPAPQPLNTYGHTGLLEMPSARMQTDGYLSMTVAAPPDSFRTSLTFQAFPWAEAAFRYSRIDNYFAGDPLEPRPDLFDRSFSLKVRLWDETEYLPAVAVGFQDVIGTGIYGSEYVVASKAYGDFDFTLGMGWGRLGSVGMFRNPFSVIDDRLDDRPGFRPGVDQGGEPLFKSMFRGRDVSLFGGVVWSTPIDGLQAILEYSGDKYTGQGAAPFRPRSQVNFGLSYRVDDLISASAAYLYGDTFSFRLSLHFDPAVETMKVLDTPPPAPQVRPAEQRPRQISEARPVTGPLPDLGELRGLRMVVSDEKWDLGGYVRTIESATDGGGLQDLISGDGWYGLEPVRAQVMDGMVKLARDQHLGVQAIELKPNYVSVFYENKRYVRETEALHRLMRVLTSLPPSVEHFYMTSLVDGIPSTEVLVSRTAYERAVQQFASVDDLLTYARISPAGLAIPEAAERVARDYPRFDWSIYPRPRTMVFDPDDPIRFGLDITLEASVTFEEGWKIEGVVTSDPFSSQKTVREGDSVLPHVRTDFRLYRDQGQTGVRQLELSKIGKFSPEVFYRVKAGLFEDMYGGVGGEVIWRPDDSNIGYGLSLYYVKQRDYDRLFEFRDYDVVTGHASIYWQDAIWRGVNVNVHLGRYLAGDYGGTIEVMRKFDSGIEIGAFATFTDVSAEDFGEGSFDKGLIIRIPFGWVAPFNTKYEVSSYLSSLVRDGGQRLYEKNPLWEDLRDTNETEIRRTWALDVTPGL